MSDLGFHSQHSWHCFIHIPRRVVEIADLYAYRVRRGARCIKVASSGGVLSLNDDPEDRQFSDEELKALVGEAARSGRSVAGQ